MIPENIKNQIQVVQGDITKLDGDCASLCIGSGRKALRLLHGRTLQQRKRQDGRGAVSWQAGWAWFPNPVLKMEKKR